MRILLADDQIQVRAALQLLLNQEPSVSVVGEAGDVVELLALIEATHPDLLLLDWRLPGLSANGSLPALRLVSPDLLVIVLCGRPELRREALQAGADAFVSKVDPPESLLNVLHTMVKGKAEIY